MSECGPLHKQETAVTYSSNLSQQTTYLKKVFQLTTTIIELLGLLKI